MPNLANAKKALRQSDKRAARNKVQLDELASLRRHFKVALKKQNIEEAKKLAHALQKKIDKAVKNNLWKANKGDRTKSRLTSAINRATGTTNADTTEKATA